MKSIIQSKTFDEERSLYNIKDAKIINCSFKGSTDGESPLKEARDIVVINSDFSLRYPIWHTIKFTIEESRFDTSSRAPIWYGKEGNIKKTKINSIKCLRNCENIEVDDCEISSEEAGWMSDNIKINNSTISGDYLFLKSNNIDINNSQLIGKYGLQYMKNVRINHSTLDTKDAFWHSENVIVSDSDINGAYLGWYSKNLTLINCNIKGTQPFCYCENLIMIHCTMDGCDLAFEYSAVDADIKGNILSVKNPKSGYIRADFIGDIILTDSIMDSTAIINTTKK
ncbi:MAG: DUF3737 family protein [Bacilli bacterium]|nr:DUF3737 family protein [Bacilli bacterium]